MKNVNFLTNYTKYFKLLRTDESPVPVNRSTNKAKPAFTVL